MVVVGGVDVAGVLVLKARLVVVVRVATEVEDAVGVPVVLRLLGLAVVVGTTVVDLIVVLMGSVVALVVTVEVGGTVVVAVVGGVAVEVGEALVTVLGPYTT